ncbi:SKP1 component, dimerization [Trema orientale]|uniref:SKP1 component, dimerization n=1 Tax=Trema orientale TaxID=63057 RepID=A0A2P5FND7_TREOI|nr:SKP1 component, dimerization [Trema orientale]
MPTMTTKTKTRKATIIIVMMMSRSWVDHKESSMEKLRAEKKRKDDLKKWDDRFTRDMDVDTLCDLLMAADYLDGYELVVLLTQKAASMMRAKTVEEIREMFNIGNDFTPREMEELEKRYQKMGIIIEPLIEPLISN